MRRTVRSWICNAAASCRTDTGPNASSSSARMVRVTK